MSPIDDRYVRAIMDGLLEEPAVALAYEADPVFHAWIITTSQALAALVPAMAQAAECSRIVHREAVRRIETDPAPPRIVGHVPGHEYDRLTARGMAPAPRIEPVPGRPAGRRAGPALEDRRDAAFGLADPVAAPRFAEGDRVWLVGMTDPTWKGKLGTVIATDGSPGSYTVDVDGYGNRLLCYESELEPPPRNHPVVEDADRALARRASLPPNQEPT